MLGPILVVCVGNICRSPVGERLLSERLAERGVNIDVASAGISALVGHSADQTAADVAKEHGVSLTGHAARQFTREIAADCALILVMEAGHKREIVNAYPELSGKIMLFDHWTDKTGIADPYQRSREFHLHVFQQLDAAATAWVDKLAKAR